MNAAFLIVAAVVGGWYANQYFTGHTNSQGTLESTATPGIEGAGFASDLSFTPSQNSGNGPFAYKFKEGEVLTYRMDAEANGLGLAQADDRNSDIGLTIGFDMNLLAEKVDSDGNAELRLDFANMTTQGGFMDMPANYSHPGAGAVDPLGQGGGPQSRFFGEPTRIRVSPDGQVRDVSGAKGMDQLLTPEAALAPVQFPSAQFEVGDRWESKFNLPVPGMGVPASADASNEIVRFENIGARRCAVILQRLSSAQANGTMDSIGGNPGDPAGFSMPRFNLTGENYIWFDVNEGKLVQSDLDMQFELALGQQLAPMSGLMKTYDTLLNDVEGRNPSAQDQQAQQNLLEMKTAITGRVRLVE